MRLYLAFALAVLVVAGGGVRAEDVGPADEGDQAAEWRPRDFKPHVRLGNAYAQKGDFHRAKIAYDRALKLKPNHAALHFMSGRALEKLFDLERANRVYSRAVALSPGNLQYRRALNRIEVSVKKGAA